MNIQNNNFITIKAFLHKSEGIDGLHEIPKVKFQLLDGVINSDYKFFSSDFDMGNLTISEYINKYTLSFDHNYKINDYIKEDLMKKSKSFFKIDDPNFKSTTIKLEKINESVFSWIKKFHNSYRINNIFSMRKEMQLYLTDLLNIKDNSSLKVLFQCFCLYYLNKNAEAVEIIEKALSNKAIGDGLQSLAEDLLKLIKVSCKKISEKNRSIAFITSVRSVETDSNLVRLIISTSKEYLGNRFCINQFDSRQYKNIGELLTHLKYYNKFQHVIFIGHASSNGHRFVFRNYFDEKSELSNEELIEFYSLLEQNDDSSIFMFTCDGEIYIKYIPISFNYIYTKDSSNNPEEEIYCGGFYKAYGCGNNLAQSHEAGKLALRFRSTYPITLGIKLKSTSKI